MQNGDRIHCSDGNDNEIIAPLQWLDDEVWQHQTDYLRRL